MLAPGITYDPDVHPPESAPQGDQLPINVPDTRIKRRHAEDGTPYRACCDDTLRPVFGRGRPNATCTRCTTARRSNTSHSYKERQRPKDADAECQQPYLDLTNSDIEDLVKLIDEMTSAVGRTSSHFKSQHRGTWQHALLLASKDLVQRREQYIPYNNDPPAEPTTKPDTNS
jgi:hypothetical protein